MDRLQLNLQQDLDSILDWFICNKITLNLSKSVSMMIGVRQKIRGKLLDIRVNDRKLTNVDKYKYLGVCIDSHLTWKPHINMLANRVRCRLRAISRLYPLPPHTISILYKAFVLPLMDYYDVVWGSASLTSLSILSRLHRRACKPMLHYAPRWNLQDRRKFHVALLTFKILHRLTPPFLFDTIKYTTSLTGRQGRNEFRVYLPHARTNIGQSSFYFRTVQIWNDLKSSYIYLYTTAKSFKFAYKHVFYF